MPQAWDIQVAWNSLRGYHCADGKFRRKTATIQEKEEKKKE